MPHDTASHVCQICQHQNNLHPAATIQPVLAKLIEHETGHWDPREWICETDLQRYRSQYVESVLQEERGELTDIEQEVLTSLREQELLAHNPDPEFDRSLSLGQRLSDMIASFGGSWNFIGLFAVLMAGWMTVNSLMLGKEGFDPYPYILLNLVLSCMAAIQAPVIMMSQNRQESRDRVRATHDYQINLKAELEIRHLHQKVDHLLTHQWERMMEIQAIQTELLGELRRRP